ncbi:hypothetical protein K488DRAFT_90283 [Vararia minispora EC-137]|uniref:Uncharacterized protein n=1 Tax=Vararia minispora EC-137 TaxID=1314806 RepID=A0ACB8Q804_9AGAM|nr:hypothetical protein K488DRAFT_90283 [Vararia minispora EC-137]
MDYDRKSAVSFYGDRRPSGDALSRDRARRDSSSSFFNPGTLPAGAQSPVAAPGYQPLNEPLHTPRSAKLEDEASASGAPVELVTVPALGPEWKASELRDMTSRGKREDKNEARLKFWREFKRNERGLFGRKWLSKRFVVWFCFGLCIAIGIVLAFTIPRVPAFLFNSDQPLQAASGWWNGSIPTQFSPSPANFSFPAIVDLQVNTGSNFLPLTFTHVDGIVYDLNSFRQVATGHLNKTTVPAKTFTTLQMPLNFTYSAVNNSDATWVSWHDACENKAIAVNGTRPGVQFRLIIQMGIAGLPGSHSTSTSVTNAPCPIELPMNAS